MVSRQVTWLVWCSSAHHDGFSIRRPGFKSRREHLNACIVPIGTCSSYSGLYVVNHWEFIPEYMYGEYIRWTY